MSNNSLDDMYKWLDVEPRTRGWNAILAYDRTKTNAVLLQEYINRFSSGDYLQPITESLKDNQTPTHQEYLVDYVMDAPRLSFTNSGLENAKARTRQSVMGGTHMAFERPVGAPAWSVTKVALWMPIDGPTLEYDIELKVTQGAVGRQGTVSLNIAEGLNYRMTYAETEHLAKFTGERLKAYFNKLPEAQKNFVLNEITIDQSHLLKPVRFVVRTHNKKGSGAALAANETEEEGAVLLFVTMEGQSDGALPARNSDLKYLLVEGMSASLLLGHKFFYESLIIEGLRCVATMTPLQYGVELKPGTQIIQRVNVSGGARGGGKMYSRTIGGVRYSSVIQALMPGNGASDFMRGSNLIKPGELSGLVLVHWKTNGQSPRLDIDGVPHSVRAQWEAISVFTISVDPQSMDLVLTHEGGGGVPTVDLSTIPMPADHREIMQREFRNWVEDFLNLAMHEYITPVRDFNVLILNSLLFRGKNRVQPKSTYFSHDLAIFGHVGPTLTAFTLNNLEPVIGRGDTFQFSTIPPMSNVTWKVENIPGSDGQPGTINSSGRYTAPNAGQFAGDYTRVRVTATAGSSSSSALVSVLRYDIAINPLVQVVGAGDSAGREVSAGALNGDALVWSIADPSTGATVMPSVKEGGDHTYYPGPKSDDRHLFLGLDQIVVTNPHTKKTERSAVLVLHRQTDITITILSGSGVPANQVKLQAAFDITPIDPEEEDLRWAVFAGSGQVDPKTGVFTVDPLGSHKFAVVTAHIPGRGSRVSDDGFIILPIPLYSVPEAIRMLTTDQTALSTD